MKITTINATQISTDEVLAPLRAKLSPDGDVVSPRGRAKTIEVFGQPLSPQQVVEKICQDVRRAGRDAVLQYTLKLDAADVTPESLRVPQARLAAAHHAAEPEFLAAVRNIRQNILQFQKAILHKDVVVERGDGVYLRQRYIPLRRVGLCVPGGAAAYPSTVLMTAVPAQAAGVEQIAVVAPPTPFGADNPDMLATCHELGVHEVYRVGGAQAVAALAYGIEGIARVDKIVGPGNLFVALAKRYVYGEVDIDSIAGPSEVVVLADETAEPKFVAAELLAQAEHSPGASILISWSDRIIAQTQIELDRQITQLSRHALTLQSLEQFGLLIRVRDASHACELTDAIAPEHLHIATTSPAELAMRIRNAGAMFLGQYTPVAVGDYAAGPSHVLPTSGTARWASGLSANDFLRSASMIHYTKDGLALVADDIRQLADKESLTAHRASVDVRLGTGEGLGER